MLLADEPAASLDAAAAAKVLQLLLEFAQAGVAVVLASQGEPAPLPAGTRRLHLAEGRLRQ